MRGSGPIEGQNKITQTETDSSATDISCPFKRSETGAEFESQYAARRE